MRRKMVRKKMEQKNNIQHDGVKSITPNGFPSMFFLSVETRAPSQFHLFYYQTSNKNASHDETEGFLSSFPLFHQSLPKEVNT
jgi:hypothetical protein